MSINGNGDTLTITGARLKVSGGVQVSGSIAYTEDATGFGGVTAQIDTDNITLNITAGKTSGVAKIERGTSANITAINHANVSNNTTIHIALKNTSIIKGEFVTIGTFANNSTVKVNYTDEYVIGPGETGMLTLRKVAGVLSLYIREMFSSTATDTTTKPFYIKDGTNYKYPLYKTTGANLVTETIGGVTYYRPSSGLKTKTRPPLGIPELIVTPTGNLAIGNSADLTTVNYDVWGVPSGFDSGSIYQGTTKKVSFLLENGEASGTFTESGVSSGDAYSLYVERTDTSTSDTVYVDTSAFIGTIAFHHDTFANSGDPYGDGTLAGATANNHIFADTQTGTYDWGTLGSASTTSTNTTYTWTPISDITGADVLMVAGGGGGGGVIGGGGGAGGLLHRTNQSLSGQKTIVIGNGGAGGIGFNNGISEHGSDGNNTTFTDLTTAYGGGGGGANGSTAGNDGGSGGGGGYDGAPGSSISGQGNIGGYYGLNDTDTAGGGGGAGGPGGNPTASVSGNGGTGLYKSSVFGTNYGDSGWFASGGAGGARAGSTAGTASQGGGTGGETTTTAAADAQKHTGGGGGGAGYNGSSTSELGGRGGSGIVLIKSPGIGKKIPKVTGASFDSTNVTFTVQDASNITNIKYTINGGSEQTTPVGTLAVAHGVSASASITVVAYAVDASDNQLSTKKTVTGTIP